MRAFPLLILALAVLGCTRPAPVSATAGNDTDTLRIRSAILASDRAAFVALPKSYTATSRSYPVLLVLDGEENFSDAVTIATTLARLGHAPEAIVVGIPNATSDPRDRVHDMTPPGLSVSGSSRNEGGDAFLDFLERELLSALRERYRAGAPTILMGHSSGGVIATYASAARPGSFPVVVAIDAPIRLDDHWLAKRLVERARRGGEETTRYVSIEAMYGWSDDRWSELVAVAPPSWLLRRETLEGESHESMGFLAMYEGLKLAFSDYSIAGAPIPPRGSAFGVFEHYRRIEEAFETRLPPPAPVLERLVEDILTEGRIEPARQALAWLIDGYGPPPDRAELEAMIERVAAMPPLAETVEDLKMTPTPTRDEMEPFVGEWIGQEWMNDETMADIALRIRNEGGSVTAEVVHLLPDGTELVQPVDYLKVVSGGLEFGVMNGIRPMGMIVFAGQREGDVLEGEQGFRGIVLPLPTGHMPPIWHFRLAKRAGS